MRKYKFIIPEYKEYTDKLDSPLKFCLITDLHSTIYGVDQAPLIQAIQEAQPDAIFMTGDIIDDKVSKKGALQLFKAIGTQYPCYYVAGNHEFYPEKPKVLKAMVRGYGIHVLAGTSEFPTFKGQQVQIAGIDDPYSLKKNQWEKQLAKCMDLRKEDCYSILLSHRPERVKAYQASGFDLIVCGHAHGGQVRIPGLINGLYAPKQGIFPKYAGGRYQLGKSAMIVSRGLCVNNIPRIFNPPELVMIHLIPR